MRITTTLAPRKAQKTTSLYRFNNAFQSVRIHTKCPEITKAQMSQLRAIMRTRKHNLLEKHSELTALPAL